MSYNPRQALGTARELLELQKQRLELTEQLVFSLELECAWPDIFNQGGFSIIDVTGRQGDRKWVFKRADESVFELPVKESPDSLLQRYKKLRRGPVHRRTFDPIQVCASSELMKRKDEKQNGR